MVDSTSRIEDLNKYGDSPSATPLNGIDPSKLDFQRVWNTAGTAVATDAAAAILGDGDNGFRISNSLETDKTKTDTEDYQFVGITFALDPKHLRDCIDTANGLQSSNNENDQAIFGDATTLADRLHAVFTGVDVAGNMAEIQALLNQYRHSPQLNQLIDAANGLLVRQSPIQGNVAFLRKGAFAGSADQQDLNVVTASLAEVNGNQSIFPEPLLRPQGGRANSPVRFDIRNGGLTEYLEQALPAIRPRLPAPRPALEI